MKVKTAVRVGQDAMSCWDFCTDVADTLGDPPGVNAFGHCLNGCHESLPFTHDEEELDCLEFCMDIAENAGLGYDDVTGWCVPACAAVSLYMD